MISRRNVLSGLTAAITTGCSAPQAPRQASVAPDHYQQTPPAQNLAAQFPIAPAPPSRAAQGLDAVIDFSANTTVSDFRLVRASNILAVIHKASEGDFYADPACAGRRAQAEAAGLLWGAYHFGKGDSPGAQQAAFFLDTSRPVPTTLLALDLEANEGDPSNSMTLEQAEAFVQAVASATGRLPLVYVHPTWANGDPLPSGLSFGARITPDSILARCGLWVADYHDSPEIPLAWATSGWRLWQYAGDEYAGHRAYGHSRIVRGLDRCDRNLFNGDKAALYRFWNAEA
ncbi:MAG: glycoside hydrolase family 25 protein [Proteobacteria bacterium]|nr:glycoside hydrolase family 25 protein [Pseudomonadota bacterium]